jgi:hypothetical protein
MNIADIIYQHVKVMPPPLAQEVLDFIEFLASRPKSAKTNAITVSAQEWESLQETLYVLQNSDLMRQISASAETYRQGKGYVPSAEELNALD